MLRNVAKPTICALAIIGIALFLVLANGVLSPVGAQDNSNTMADKLRELVSRDKVIGISFIAPGEGTTLFWAIPDNIGADKSTLRTMSEIGSDHFCVRESSEGAIVVKCVPFTNITQITYEDMQ